MRGSEEVEPVGDAEDERTGNTAEDEGALNETQEALQAKPAFFKGPEPFAQGGDGPGRATEK